MACGYNAGWKDSTTRVMRVGGEPRSSFIVSPADGRVADIEHQRHTAVADARCGVVDPRSLDDYRANGGWTGLERAIAAGPAVSRSQQQARQSD